MNKHWTIRQYGAVLADFLEWVRSDAALEAETHVYLQKLGEHGNMLRQPYSKPLRDGIFELLPHTDEIQARLLYFFGVMKDGSPKAVITNTFVKKTRKTPDEEIALAKKRRKELEDQDKGNRKKRGSYHHGNRTTH
ncbi:MAG: type II toxin-antitoxin system RelE/ParE family toxin [Nitrospirota bacterium]|nr:type II toxin-antitoxin system RelE/ParE family toxin [Nitrospirota bacterium]